MQLNSTLRLSSACRWGMASQISSQVKARIGANIRVMASTIRNRAVWALRRLRLFSPSQYRRSLMISK